MKQPLLRALPAAARTPAGGSRARIAACASSRELRLFRLLQHVNAPQVREEPGKTPRCLRSPAPYPTTQTHQRAHVHVRIQHGHKNALAVKHAAYLGRTKSTKRIPKASPERVRAKSAATHGGELASPPPAPLNRPLKVGGRIKTDEGGAPPEKHVRRCPAALATAAEPGPGPKKDTPTEAELTHRECWDTHGASV